MQTDRGQDKAADERKLTQHTGQRDAAATDARSDVRAHVAAAPSWSPDEAARHAATDLAAYHAPRASRPGDAQAMQHLREDMALRARNSEPYRVELQTQDPKTLREVLAQPIVTANREGEQQDRAASPSVNTVAAVSERVRPADTELDAQQRLAAKASIAANDRQADAKREVVDHMTPEELKRVAAAGPDKAKADQVLRDAAARQERATATGPMREPTPPLAERFNIRRSVFTKEYEFRDRPGTVAFAERLGTLRTAQSSPAVAIAMIDRAGERGWSTVRVTGSAEFKRQAWIAAEARGIKAIGYEPTKGDIEAAQAERGRLQKEAGWQGGTVQKATERPSAERPSAERPTAERSPAERFAPEPSAAERQSAGASGPMKAQGDQDQLAGSLGTTRATPAAQTPETAPPVQAAEATRTRQTEEAIRRDPSSDDERRSAAKEDRKAAEFALMTGALTPEHAGKAVPGAARDASGASRDGAASVDVPSLAGSSTDRGRREQLGNERGDESGRNREPGHNRDPGQAADRGTDQRLGRDVDSAAFMRALEQVMERDRVPESLRPQIRTVAQQHFAALRQDNKTVRVRLVDRAAPRQTPVQLPRYDIKRAQQERAR